jgi:uncharacterized repeat protein (TIGR03803 family)
MTPAKPERSTGTARNSNAEFSTIYDFGAKFEEGNTPNGRLIMDASGKLYGVTINGGITTDDGLGHGVVFMLVPEGAASGGTYQYHVLHKFAGGPSEGARPVGGLSMDSAGNLYGTTAGGGSGWTGTVFKLTNSGDGYQFTNLYQFSAISGGSSTNSDGAGPTSHLTMDSTGNLFGTTSAGGINGGGTVFKLTKQPGGGYAFANLHNFGAPQGYDDTTGPLTMDASGNLYGLKAAGGEYASGELFALYVQGNAAYAYASLYSFPLIDYVRALPYGSLAMDKSGNLFGTTSGGGRNLSGTVFEYSTSTGGTPTTLYDFNDSGQGGFSPYAGVILDSAGNLFGTVDYSTPGYGAVYKLVNNGNGTYTYATLFEFTESKRQGNAPQNTLVADALGHLFGTTYEGGTYDGGVAFRITIGETAQAIAVMEGGVVLQIVVTNPGRGYTSPPTVTITPSGNGMTAQAVATISNGSVTAVSVTNQGSGYDFGPQVSFSPP